MQAILALEDGRIFRGAGYGAKAECYGEVVFNTSLTGYQEIFTDPSYAGQIVVLTNPQVGNYGTNPADEEATRPYIEGLVVREFSPISSNWRSEQLASDYLERFNVPAISDIDTRALVRHLRVNGTMGGVISCIETDTEKLDQEALWKTIVSAFTVIFLAEWGDMTQLTTVALVARYGHPVLIFAAATLALWSVTGVGVLVGYQARKILKPSVVARVGAVLFLAAGIVMIWQA